MFFRKKEFNNLPEAGWTWKGYTKKQLIISVLVLYVILMISTGLVIHYGFCQGHSTKSTTAVSVSLQRSTLDVISRSAKCPVPANCPLVPECEIPMCPGEVLALPQYCVTTPEPPCTTSLPCITECGTTCAPIITGTTTTDPPSITLTMDQMTKTETLALIRSNPVQSYARLQVIIHLMENWFERYHTIYTRRSCGYDVRRICPLCLDRYPYLRCVFIHDVNRGLSANAKILKPFPANADKDINERGYYTAYRGTYDTGATLRGQDYTDFYNNMQGAMAFGFSSSGSCIPCDGENARQHMLCISDQTNANTNAAWPNVYWGTPYYSHRLLPGSDSRYPPK